MIDPKTLNPGEFVYQAQVIVVDNSASVVYERFVVLQRGGLSKANTDGELSLAVIPVVIGDEKYPGIIYLTPLACCTMHATKDEAKNAAIAMARRTHGALGRILDGEQEDGT